LTKAAPSSRLHAIETTQEQTTYEQDRNKPSPSLNHGQIQFSFRDRVDHYFYRRHETATVSTSTLHDPATDIEVDLADIFDEE